VPEATEAENYDEYYCDDNLSVPEFIIGRVNEIVDEFSGFRETNRLLDIGFGAGTILDVASQHGWKSHGLEVSKPAVDQARIRGYEVFHGGLREAKFPDHYFDVITASEILEHLPEPEADLREIVRILRPGGLFWGTTPSARGLSFRLLKLNWSVLSPPEHIQLYSKAGAMILLTKAGFNQINFRTNGLNPMEIVDHFRPNRSTDHKFDRVDTGYLLNEGLTKSPSRKMIKALLNRSLDVLGLGDSLKIYAQTNK